MKNRKKIILVFISTIIPLLLVLGLATWIILDKTIFAPRYNSNSNSILYNAFDGQSTDYSGSEQGPTSIDPTIHNENVSFSYRLSDSIGAYKKGLPTNVGTYDILVKDNNDVYIDDVIRFTINPINPTIATLPVATKPTIEGEVPSMSQGEVKGIDVDGTLTGKWTFDTSNLVFGKQSIDRITKKVTSTFVPDSVNYKPINIDLDVELLAVAKINSSYFGTVEQAIDESQNSNNIFVIAGIYDLTGFYPTIKTDKTIPSGVTLTLTYRIDDYTTGYKIFENQESYSEPSHLTSYGAQLCVDNNVTLNVNGTIIIGAYVGSSSAVHSKEFAVLMNKGIININQNAFLKSYGYLKGTGKVNIRSGATVNDLFRIYDFVGARYAGVFFKTMKKNSLTKFTYDYTYNNIMPFNCYSIHNISCPLRVDYGANYYGRYQLNVSSTIYAGDIILIGNGGLFQLSSGYLERTIGIVNTSAEQGYAAFNNNSYTDSNQGIYHLEIYDFYCSLSDNTISVALSLDATITTIDLNVTTSTDVAMPIGLMHFNFHSGSSGTFSSNSYKFLPGSKLTIDEGATIQFSQNTNIVIYDEYYDDYVLIDSNSNNQQPSNFSYFKQRNKLYISSSTMVNEKYKSELIVNGKLICNGGFGGKINKGLTGEVILNKQSATIKWLTSIKYLDNTTVLGFAIYKREVDLGGVVRDDTVTAEIIDI